MEKEVKTTIEIQRIKGTDRFSKPDEVAIEYNLDIPLKNGEVVHVTCTPSYLEEMTLARRYLAGDLAGEEYNQEGKRSVRTAHDEFGMKNTEQVQKQKCETEHDSENDEETEAAMTTDLLTEVSLEEIFRIAHDSFENPGPLFVTTGCAHSCALVYKGEVVCCIEDIGRHNALDKVIGYALKHNIPISGSYIFSSGRISEDYLEKAIAAGFRMVVSRAAVTDAAVRLAQENGITMLGFIRKNTGNIYCEEKVSLKEIKIC